MMKGHVLRSSHALMRQIAASSVIQEIRRHLRCRRSPMPSCDACAAGVPSATASQAEDGGLMELYMYVHVKFIIPIALQAYTWKRRGCGRVD